MRKVKPSRCSSRLTIRMRCKAGLWALSLWGSFYIALVVEPKAQRGIGLGAELMHRAEEETRKHGCRRCGWIPTHFKRAPSTNGWDFRCSDRSTVLPRCSRATSCRSCSRLPEHGGSLQ